MFTSQDIFARLRDRPFHPFRIMMTGGATYDVIHPDQAVVTRGYLTVGLPPEAAEDGGIFERTADLAILHITEIRPISRRRKRRTS